jgi:hypothetical protein
MAPAVEVVDRPTAGARHRKLLLIDNVIDQSTATIRLKAMFPNEDESCGRANSSMRACCSIRAATLLSFRPVPFNADRRGCLHG